jgi:hypothetical protein
MNKIKIFRGGLVFLSMIITLLGHSTGVSAVGRQAPDPSDYTSGNNVYLQVGRSGRGNNLDAPNSEIRVYVPTGAAGTDWLGRAIVPIEVNNGNANCTGDSNVAAPTNFVMFARYEGGFVSSVTDGNLGCGWDTINVRVGGAPVTTLNKKTYYTVTVIASHTGRPNSGGVNAFKIRGPSGSYASYYNGSGNKFAIQDRLSNPDSGQNNFSLKFGPDCNMLTAKNVTLKWFDDDYNTGNQQNNLRFEVFEVPFEQKDELGKYRKILNYTGPFTGNNKPGQTNITIKPGYVYTWNWLNVRNSNGIQFQLPYNSIFFEVDCSYTTQLKGFWNVKCGNPSSKDEFGGGAQDFDRIGSTSNRFPVRVSIDGQVQNWNGTGPGTLQSSVVDSAGNAVFSKTGNVVPAAFRDGNQHTMKVEVVEYPQNNYIDFGSKKFTCPGGPVVNSSNNKSTFDDAATGMIDGKELTAGQVYTIAIKAWNEGNKLGITVPLVRTDQPTIVEDRGVSNLINMDTQFLGDPQPMHYDPGDNPACSPPPSPINSPECWSWVTKNMRANSSSGAPASTGRFRFKVKDDAVTGTQICFNIYNKPRGDNFASQNYYDGGDRCFIVKAKPSHPLVKFNGGDIQAGANLTDDVRQFNNQGCDPLGLSDAEVRGGKGPSPLTNDYSAADYGVFATGDIDKFASNAKVFNGWGLDAEKLDFKNIGSQGKYAAICRPDLAAPINITGLDVMTLTNEVSGVYSVSVAELEGFGKERFLLRTSSPGGNIRITGGQVSNGRKLTVIADDSNVQISDNITYSGNYANRNAIPSFALIAGKDITIRHNVSLVSGFYSATGLFDTCGGQDGARSSYEIESPIIQPSFGNKTAGEVCRNRLTVYGAVMAEQILFRRTVAGIDVPTLVRDSGSKYAETFTFAPELILSPPYFGSTISTSVTRNGYQELPPVF